MKLWQTHQRQQHSPPRMSRRRGASFSSLSFLLSNFLLLRGDHKSTASAFSWVSNEKIPLDPNNGIKSAYTNDPVVVKPMPHQPSEQENMPYEFWLDFYKFSKNKSLGKRTSHLRMCMELNRNIRIFGINILEGIIMKILEILLQVN